jgi:hypothetical protein
MCNKRPASDSLRFCVSLRVHIVFSQILFNLSIDHSISQSIIQSQAIKCVLDSKQHPAGQPFGDTVVVVGSYSTRCHMFLARRLRDKTKRNTSDPPRCPGKCRPHSCALHILINLRCTRRSRSRPIVMQWIGLHCILYPTLCGAKLPQHSLISLRWLREWMDDR